MTPQLPKELIEALHANGPDGLEVVDPDTNRVYMIVDGKAYREAREALRRQQDRAAIAEGLAQMEAGEGRSAHEALEDLRTRLGFPQER